MKNKWIDKRHFRQITAKLCLGLILLGGGKAYSNEIDVYAETPQKWYQQFPVKGQVTDASGVPLPGVSVVVKGKASKGVATDFDGNFSIDVDSGEVLVFSYVGFATKEVKVDGKKSINIVLKEQAQELGQVVVTALGIKRAEKSLSYNVQKIGNDEITKVKDANFVNTLNGKVAGVQINRSASGVGGATKVVMRGAKSIEGNNNVLYVVDGIPLLNIADRSGDGTGFGGAASGEGISSFNPDDIESVNVLSGPAAAALYGAAAANGVIIINTKKGKEGKTSVKVSSSVEVSSPLVFPRFQNTYGSNGFWSWGEKFQTPSSFEANTAKLFLQNGYTFNNSVSLSTGTQKNQTYVSASALNADGIVPNNKYHRYNATLRNTTKLLDDKLTIDASAGYVREYANNMVSFGTYFNPIVGVYLYPRGVDFNQEKYFERYNSEKGYNMQYWSPGDFGMSIDNPYWIAYRNIRPEVKDRYMFYAQAKYDFNDNLNVAARLRLDNTIREKEDKRYSSTNSVFAGNNGRYAYSSDYMKQRYADVLLNYRKDFFENYNLNINVGSSFEDTDEKGRGYGGDLLLVPNKFTYTNIDPSRSSPSENGGNSRVRNVAVFSSAEISYKSALYLTLTGRSDKNSKLVNTNSEWTFYPSVGLSAVITEFLSPERKDYIQGILEYLKVRASYTDVASPISKTGITQGTITRKIKGGNIEAFDFYPIGALTRQATRSWEVGLDARMFNNALSLGVTLYKSNTLDQLIEAKLSNSSGYNFMYYQSGNLENKGIELTLGFNKKVTENLKYSTVFTATANRNKIVELSSNIKNPIDGSTISIPSIQRGRFLLKEGGSYGDVYAFNQIKRDKYGYFEYNPGGGLITEQLSEPLKLGSINPDWNLGWSTSFDYKGFNLYLLFNARLGGIVISKTQAALDKYGVSQRSADARDAGGVQLGNVLVDARTFYNTVYDIDSYNTYDATNVRLQQASIGYTFGNQFFEGVIKNLNISIIGNNLWMIYNKAPYDPELTASTGYLGQGFDYFMLPSLRNVGFSVKFEL